jgi:Annexin
MLMKKAMDGSGCDREAVNDVMVYLSTEEIREMRIRYEGENHENLADRLRSELSGGHQMLILRLLVNGRSRQSRDMTKAGALADRLYDTFKHGKGMLTGLKSAAENSIIEIFTDESQDQLKAVAVRV